MCCGQCVSLTNIKNNQLRNSLQSAQVLGQPDAVTSHPMTRDSGFWFLMGVAAKLNGRLRSVITIIINKDTCKEYYNPWWFVIVCIRVGAEWRWDRGWWWYKHIVYTFNIKYSRITLRRLHSVDSCWCRSWPECSVPCMWHHLLLLLWSQVRL